MSKFNLKHTAVVGLFAAAICAVSAAPASALPLYIGYSLNGGAKTTLVPLLAVPGLEIYSGTISDGSGGAQVSVTFNGSPGIVAPGIVSSNEISANFTGAGTLKLFLTETQLTSQFTGGLVSGFGQNGLAGSVVETTYAAKCTTVNCAGAADIFNTVHQLSTATLTNTSPASTQTAVFPASITPGALYDVTLEYTFSWTGGSGSNASLSLAGITGGGGPGTGVPEPLTVSLFGAGLLGAAVSRRRKKKA